jgi:glycosyltransferase involved in cell wall biosynthesis
LKILINTPDTGFSGGVASHYKGLLPFWVEDVDYHTIGTRNGIPGFVLFPFDVFLFFTKLIFFSYDAVLINPSLGKKSLIRDAIYLRISSFFKLKKIVFFHGWDQALADKISDNPDWFLRNFKSADAFLVLASSFKRQMESWGVTKRIGLTTTKVDDFLIDGFDLSDRKFSGTLLFLARLEVDKGIFLALEVFEILQKERPELRLIVAGTGGAFPQAKKIVLDRGIGNVEFLGNVSGNDLIAAFANSDIYLFPTWYGEGMPTSVLEAMAFGLPIVSRPVGGLVDFFEEGSMGYLVDSLSASDFVEKIIFLLADLDRIKHIGIYNQNYARNHFMASRVASQLEIFIGEGLLDDDEVL